MSTAFAIGQLRHLYAQMLAGQVKNTQEAARGLLGPAIEELERSNDAEVLAAAKRALIDLGHNAPEDFASSPETRCKGHCHCHAGADGVMHPPCCGECASSSAEAALSALKRKIDNRAAQMNTSPDTPGALALFAQKLREDLGTP